MKAYKVYRENIDLEVLDFLIDKMEQNKTKCVRLCNHKCTSYSI